MISSEQKLSEYYTESGNDKFYIFLLGLKTDDSIVKYLPFDMVEMIYKKYLCYIMKPTIDISNLAGYRELAWMNTQGRYHRDHDLPAQIHCCPDGRIKRLIWSINGQEMRDNLDLPIDICYDDHGSLLWMRFQKSRSPDKPVTIMRKNGTGAFTCSFYTKSCENFSSYHKIPKTYLY